MIRIILLCFAVASLLTAQDASSKMSDAEEQALKQAVMEAGSNTTELIRALERHLEKFPNTPERPDLELALAKSAIELKDNPRILTYGEKVLGRGMEDPQILERVTRALLTEDTKDRAERALKYAQRLETLLIGYEKEPVKPGTELRIKEEFDRATGRALVFQARATGNLGRHAEAAKLAERSYERYPTAESAREIGKWKAADGKADEALRHYADAFVIADPRNTETDRAKDRLKMSEIYRKAHDSDSGLGEYLLDAYDRTSALLADRRMRLQKLDPNAQVTNPMDYTISGLAGEKVPLNSLKGKVVIMDFWATWCGPCRAQHPLFEEVKKRFKDRKDVVFLPISTDEDHTLVPEFLEKHAWEKKVYFDEGLAGLLQVSSIPTTIIFDRSGAVVSRMNGFIPERFADQLTERIRELVQ